MVDYRIIQKWAPIMDSLKIKDKQVREFLSEYAESHYIINRGKENNNLLPMSMKILSKTNLKYVNFEISKEDIPEHTYQIPYYFPKSDDINAKNGMDTVRDMEDKVMEFISDDINLNLESNDTIILYDLISNIEMNYEIGLVTVKSKTPRAST